jgi:DNA repair ATPase RecN
MLGDTELQNLDAQLKALGRSSREHHDTVQEVLDKYQNLIENYRRLKSDYEEEKESREKYKKLARGQVCSHRRSSLIDNGHIESANSGPRNVIRSF